MSVEEHFVVTLLTDFNHIGQSPISLPLSNPRKTVVRMYSVTELESHQYRYKYPKADLLGNRVLLCYIPSASF